MQDDAGFIWVGTTNGINVYDGFSFKKFQNIPTDSNTLSSNIVNDFEKDESGTIWIGCNNALNTYNQKKKIFSNKSSEHLIDKLLGSFTVLSLLYDGNDKMWIGTENGLNSYSFQTNNYVHYSDTTVDNLIGRSINSLYLDRNNDIWISTDKGAFIFNSKQNRFYKILDKVANVINVQEINSTGNFYVATSTEILKVNKLKKTSEVYFSLNQLSSEENFITSILYDKKGNLWIGTTYGLILKSFYSSKFEIFRHSSSNPSSLVDNSVTDLFEDKAGIIWIGTNGGISVYDSRNLKFRPFIYSSENKNGLSSNFVWGLIEDSEGYFWLGTNYGLNKFDIKSNSYKYFLNEPNNKNSLINNRVISIYEDTDGFLWLGTDQGICKLNKKTEKFEEIKNLKNHEGLYNDYIISIKSEKNGDLWIGSDSHGLFHYSKKTEQFEQFNFNSDDQHSLSSNIVYCIYVDDTDNVWIGTNKGLNLYNSNTNNFIRFNLDNNYKFQEKVLSVSRYNDSLLFVGTVSGLYKIVLNLNDLSVKQSELYTIANGLPDNRICGLVFDFKQNLWISTKNGLCRILKNDLVKHHKDELLKIRTYDETEGLQSNEFLVQSFNSGKEGRLLFGGTKGFNIFNPDDITDNHFIPNVVITDLLIFNKPVEPLKDSTLKNPENNVLLSDNKYYINENIAFTKQITLSYYEKMFSINFVSLHLSKPWKNSYAYKLEGFDNEWNYVGNQHSATYTNIPAGAYNFKVIATNADGVWNDFGTTLKIIITPPWWQTWWFRILLITIIIVLFVLYVKIRERKLIKDKQHLEKIVDQRTKELINKNEELQQQKEEIESQRDEIESQRDEILKSRDTVITQKNELEIIHSELTSSIHYALRIQNAILPSADFFNGLVSDYFLLNCPKDIISGDFYWYQKRNNYLLIAVADCTGHGVPGAFMSMLGIAYLNEICSRNDITTASSVLDELREKIIISLKQKSEISDAEFSSLQFRDGMDISLIAIKLQNPSSKSQVTSEEESEKVSQVESEWLADNDTKLQSSEMFIAKETNPNPELQSSEMFIEKEYNNETELQSSEMFIAKETNPNPELQSSEMFIEKENNQSSVISNQSANNDTKLQSSEMFIEKENNQSSVISNQSANNENLTSNIKHQTSNFFNAQWAGANNPLWIVSSDETLTGFKTLSEFREDASANLNRACELNEVKPQTSTELASSTKLNLKLYELKGDKMPISTYERMDKFANNEFVLNKGDIIYLMSDGYEDQFGGEKNKKFKAKNLKNLLINNSHLPMFEQKNILESTLTKWLANTEQIDDITILGIKL